MTLNEQKRKLLEERRILLEKGIKNAKITCTLAVISLIISVASIILRGL